MTLRIETMRIDDLIPYVGNAKQHTDKQVDQIAASISEFGMNDPIAIWHNPDGDPIIVEGHGRLLALKKLGRETVECIILDHLTDSQRKAYTLIHNQLTMNTGFDLEKLSIELENVSSDFDMDFYGFNLPEIDFDMNNVPDLTDEEYDEPEHDMCKCPQCGFTDRKEHFKA